MYAIGVDVGGTKIEAALINEKGEKLNSYRIPSGAGKKVYENIVQAISKVKTEEILGVGIGIPGVIKKGRIVSRKIYLWRKILGRNRAIKKLSKEYKVEVKNDADCFGLAEHKLGAGKGTKNMVGIIWGTGIGSAVIKNNELIENTEEGQMKINGFSWEILCSGPSIVTRYRSLGGKFKFKRPDEIFNSKDKAAVKVKEKILKYMGIALAKLIKKYDPEIIVMGGGVSNLDVYDRLNEEVQKNIQTDCKVVKNKLGDSSGVIGAANLILSR